MLSPAPSMNPTDEIYYQTHYLEDGIWLIDESRLDRRQLGPVLDQRDSAEQSKGGAFRIVRFVTDRRGILQDQTIVHCWPDADDTIDRVMPAVGKAADVLWLGDDDIYSDLSRYLLGRGYAAFLKGRRLCVEELLHHPAGGMELVDAWQIMQAGLQPIALMQAHVMDLSGPERARELTQMLESLFASLAKLQKSDPPPELTPATYIHVFKQVKSEDPQRVRYNMARALATHLAPCKSFTEKMRHLIELADVVETREQAEPLDYMLASMIGAQGFLVDLAAGRTPIQWLTMLANMLMGHFEGDKGIGINFQPLNELVLAGFLPQTRAAIRRRIILEAKSIGGSAMGDDLIAELSEIDRTGAQLEQLAPSLVGDPELAAVWQHRISRALTADNLQRILVQHRQPTERLSVVSSLFPMMRNLNNRNQLGRLLAAQLSIHEIARELGSVSAKPLAAMPPLLKFHQRIAGYQFDDAAKEKLLNGVDAYLFGVIEMALAKTRDGDDIDRITTVLKTWLPAPMDRGRTRALVQSALGDVLQQPEFFNRFWDSFRSPKVRQQANEALERLLHDYDLKSEKIARALKETADD